MRRILIMALVLSACSSVRESRPIYEPDDSSRAQIDVWRVEVAEPAAVLITAYLGFDEGDGWDGGDAMEPLADQPYAFQGAVPHDYPVLISIEIEGKGVGVCGQGKADYCGPVRLWTNRHSSGKLMEVRVRFSSFKTNPVLEDQVACGDETIKLDYWKDYRCVYSEFAFSQSE